MPGPKALQIRLTDTARKHREKTVRKQTAPQRQVRRSQVALLAAEGPADGATDQQLGCLRCTVWMWGKRFAERRGAGLQSKPQSGRPWSFSPQQR